MESLAERAAQNLSAVREKKPLIHNITNFVAANFTANALLAMGASPVMAHAASEVEEMAELADVLVLNMGTLTEERISAMVRAGKKYNALGKPVILDPVGSGATTFRTFIARKMIAEFHISLIRGNASEILSLGRADTRTKGVDTVHSVEEVAATAKVLAEALSTPLAVTGPTDWVTDGNRCIRVLNGHPMMAYVTGCGCAATAAIAAFAAVDPDPVRAAATALAFFGLAGEVAGANASAPGSYMIELINALFTISPEALSNGSKAEGYSERQSPIRLFHQ